MTRCCQCGKDLSKVEEIHAMDGFLYCTETCAVQHVSRRKSFSTAAEARAYYRGAAETVTPHEIGIAAPKVRNKVVEILMRRDGMSQEDAEALVASVRETVEQCGGSFEAASDIIADELGLEMDYIFDILG